MFVINLLQALGQAAVWGTAIAVHQSSQLFLHALIMFLLPVERFRKVAEALIQIWHTNVPCSNPATSVLGS